MRKQQRVLRDEYFTDSNIAKQLIKIFDKKEGFNKFKVIIEPSAGNGSFFTQIPRNTPKNLKVIGLDIKPRHPDIVKQNFLTWKPKLNADKDKVLCIGNPPFGRQSALAKQFIHKCSQISNHIAFILPISFNTSSYIKSLPPNFTKKWSITLDDDIFIDNKGRYYEQPIKTIFVYYTLSNKTPKQLSIKSNGLWKFNLKTNAAQRNNSHFRLIRASGTPGRAIHRTDDRFHIEGNTYNDYYIELLPPIRRYASAIVNDINEYQAQHKWIFNNTTTFKSIDKTQAARVLNKITSKYAS